MDIYKCIFIIDSLVRGNESIEVVSMQELKYLLYQICSESSIKSDMSFQDTGISHTRLQDHEIKPIVSKLFPKLGYYHIVLNLSRVTDQADIALGDSIDDLCDIIKDISEVKWRMEHIGASDAISYMRFMFKIHTENHILGLISHINELD